MHGAVDREKQKKASTENSHSDEVYFWSMLKDALRPHEHKQAVMLRSAKSRSLSIGSFPLDERP